MLTKIFIMMLLDRWLHFTAQTNIYIFHLWTIYSINWEGPAYYKWRISQCVICNYNVYFYQFVGRCIVPIAIGFAVFHSCAKIQPITPPAKNLKGVHSQKLANHTALV